MIDHRRAHTVFSSPVQSTRQPVSRFLHLDPKQLTTGRQRLERDKDYDKREKNGPGTEPIAHLLRCVLRSVVSVCFGLALERWGFLCVCVCLFWFRLLIHLVFISRYCCCCCCCEAVIEENSGCSLLRWMTFSGTVSHCGSIPSCPSGNWRGWSRWAGWTAGEFREQRVTV